MTGQIPDISKFLHFSFFEPVYYHTYSDSSPSASNEEQGWWVGIAIHVGDSLTYKILTKHNKIIYRSAVRSALDPAKRNKRLSPLGGETASNYLGDTLFIRSKLNFENNSLDDDPSIKRRMVTIDPKELIGCTFLTYSEEDGQRFRARVVRAVVDKEDNLKRDPKYMRFSCEVPNSTVEEIYTYLKYLTTLKKIRTTSTTIPNSCLSSEVLPLIKALFEHPTRIIKVQHTMC